MVAWIRSGGNWRWAAKSFADAQAKPVVAFDRQTECLDVTDRVPTVVLARQRDQGEIDKDLRLGMDVIAGGFAAGRHRRL